MLSRLLILLLSVVCAACCCAQTGKDSGRLVVQQIRCKGFWTYYIPGRATTPVFVFRKAMPPVAQQLPPKLLTVHGNILYDLNYRSNIDTPYAEKDVYQHTLQTYLDITYKDHYPMRLYLTTRFSNSGYFRNFSDINFQFNQPAFKQIVRDQIRKRLQENLPLKDTAGLRSLLDKNLKDIASLRDWLKNPSVFQRMVEEKEKDMQRERRKQAKGAGGTDSLVDTRLLQVKADSLGDVARSRVDSLERVAESMRDKYAHAKKLLDSLESQTGRLERQYEKWKQDKEAADPRNGIDNIGTLSQLKEKMQSLRLSDTILPKGYKQLFALRSFGIGRSVLDYSALTARNISITGIQVEYNPSWYAAVASGFVDYRFRDFVVQTGGPKQYATVLRFGHGDPEGNHLIFSYYFGRRQLYNSATTAQTVASPNYNLVGYSLEGRYTINKNAWLTGEVAKSSLPYYDRANAKGSLLSQATAMNDKTNMAYMVQLQTYFPATYTRLTGSYQHAGSNFQSFSVFTSGAAQTNWMARVEQPFFRRRLNIVASMRTNEYVNPYIGYSFSGNTVFKSLQATLRIPKWPTLSLGYSPSSQLTRLSDTQYYENQFYTLTGTLTHFYRWRQLTMNSTLVYSRFYNRAGDSGFVYFNTQNWLFSQNIFLNRFSVLLNLSESANTEYTLYGVEGGGRYKVKKWLSLQGSLKYNRQTVYSRVVYGYSAGATIKVPRLGEIQGVMDKGFIPGGNKALVPNNTGRLSYFKVF